MSLPLLLTQLNVRAILMLVVGERAKLRAEREIEEAQTNT